MCIVYTILGKINLPAKKTIANQSLSPRYVSYVHMQTKKSNYLLLEILFFKFPPNIEIINGSCRRTFPAYFLNWSLTEYNLPGR
jgi:hypothetical protein